MSEEEQGFVIRDKRGRSDDQTSTPDPLQPEAPSPSEPSPAQGSSEAQDTADFCPPVTFASFIFSLGSSALMLMGEPLGTDQPALPANLPQAKEVIDILSVLETKTQGNLSPEEQTILADMLYTLRMKYVEKASGEK